MNIMMKKGEGDAEICLGRWRDGGCVLIESFQEGGFVVWGQLQVLLLGLMVLF